MADAIAELLMRTYDATAAGRYVKAGGNLNMRFGLGPDHFVKAIRDNQGLLMPLQAAFNHYPPLDDEVCIYVFKQTVITNRRMFFLRGIEPKRPPIALADIADYEEPGWIKGNERITMASGEVFSRDVMMTPSAANMKRLIADAKGQNPAGLHGKPSGPVAPTGPRTDDSASRDGPTGRHDGDSHPAASEPAAAETHSVGEFLPIAGGVAAFFLFLLVSGSDAFADPGSLLVYGIGAAVIGAVTASQAKSWFRKNGADGPGRAATSTERPSDPDGRRRPSAESAAAGESGGGDADGFSDADRSLVAFVFDYDKLEDPYGHTVYSAIIPALRSTTGKCRLADGEIETVAGGVSHVPAFLRHETAGWRCVDSSGGTLSRLEGVGELPVYLVLMYQEEHNSRILHEALASALGPAYLGCLLPDAATRSRREFEELAQRWLLIETTELHDGNVVRNDHGV